MSDGLAGRPRARLITVAWGDRYVAELFDFTLAAALAPGNLPALVGLLDCEIVILTEEARFDGLRRHPVFQALERKCAVELRSVDEFVTRPDAYGMALTYSLFRGFEDLGADMVNVHLIFLNSDFILADGSLATVAAKIVAGERLILAPSYCVVGEVVGPELARQRDTETWVLSVPPRELAALGIRCRHNTIRGKTVNQRLFSMEWIDQFYWLVDQQTILGRQMPIAVVSMRPERVLTEMVTFWDYGIISEACPNTPRCVISDSDDFLMIELRSADTARDQIRLGWPSPKEIARRLYRFTTADPIELANHTLILHSDHIPPDSADAEARLDAFVALILSYLKQPIDYFNHYIWKYHYPTFQNLRAAYRASKGIAVTGEALSEYPPPPSAETLDASFEAQVAGVADDRRAGAAAWQSPKPLDASAFLWWQDRQRRGLPPGLRALARGTGENVLVVTSENLPNRLFDTVTGLLINVGTLIGAVGLCAKPLPAGGFIGLCLCQLDVTDLGRLGALVEAVAPHMLPDGKILVWHPNSEKGPLALAAEIFKPGGMALELPCRAVFDSGQPLAGATVSRPGAIEPARLHRATPPVTGSSRGEELPRVAQPCREGTLFDQPPGECISMTIEIDMLPSARAPFDIGATSACRNMAAVSAPSRPRVHESIEKIRTVAAQAAARGLASQLTALTAEKDAVAAECVRIAAEKDVVAAECARIAAQKDVVAAECARIGAEKDAVAAECARISTARDLAFGRVVELENHNRLLTEAVTAGAHKLNELENHNRQLTEVVTEQARTLQQRSESDYQIVMAQQQLLAGMQDADPQFQVIYQRCREYTMTSIERLYALYKSVEYIVRSGLKGDLVETGVWRGGSCMLMAETLIAFDDTSRRIFLFDTYEGHPKPDETKDVDLWGNRAVDDWHRHAAEAEPWAYVSVDEARANLARTGYPSERLVFVKGMVEETIPRTSEINELALLRLDTDWYESARVSLEQLFPRLVEGGVLIVDDYGHYRGQQQAVDEYLAAMRQNLLLNRIDYSCRVAVKNGSGKR
jgi:Macrocin-O-methyltransferase (TylF)